MCNELVPIGVPFSMFDDQKLAGLFNAAQLWITEAEALGVCIRDACLIEGSRRHWNREHPEEHREAAHLAIEFRHWSDADVGKALLVVSVFSKAATIPEFGELCDELLDALAKVSCLRLAATSDPRNGSTFTERLKGSRNGNAEAN